MNASPPLIKKSIIAKGMMVMNQGSGKYIIIEKLISVMNIEGDMSW